MAGKGGGAWKVAYADFVTAMMAFFMVMWLTSQKQDVKEAVADHFKDPQGSVFPFLHKQDRKGKSIYPATKPSLASEEEPEARLPRMMTLREPDVPRAAAVVYFEETSAEISEDARQQLKRLIPWIAGKPHKLELRGHTTAQPPPAGSARTSAWELSYARCLAVLHELEGLGIPASRIRMSQAAAHEPGSIHPDPAAQAKNSRVEIYLLSEITRNLVGTSEEREERTQTPELDSKDEHPAH